MNAPLGIAVDLLVATLLIATIVTSIGLSRRMARMRADESAMRKTIGDLLLATDTAERAISTLRTTLGESDKTLGEQLRTAERYSVDLASRVQAGETVMSRIAQIVETTRRAAATETERPVRFQKAANDSARDAVLKAAAAAQAVSERATRRLEAKAA